jgi:hypothetical protein
MKILPVISLWLMAGRITAYCEQENLADAAIQSNAENRIATDLTTILPDLSHQDHMRRQDASQALLSWVKVSRKESVVTLLDVATGADKPETRERVLQVLRTMAIAEYHEIGEGYCGIQMTADPIIIAVPGRGKLAAISLAFVANDGPAAKAGLCVNDLIVSADEMVWTKPDNQMVELREVIRKKGAGNTIKLGIMRDGSYHESAVQLHRRPPNIDKTNTHAANMIIRGGMQQMQRIDQQYLDKLTQEDRDSDHFFAEWLRREKEQRKHK